MSAATLAFFNEIEKRLPTGYTLESCHPDKPFDAGQLIDGDPMCGVSPSPLGGYWRLLSKSGELVAFDSLKQINIRYVGYFPSPLPNIGRGDGPTSWLQLVD